MLDKSFASLVGVYGYGNDATGSTQARRYPLSLIYSGYFYWNNGGLYYQGSYGYWWSRTANSDTLSYSLFVGSSYLLPQDGNNKLYGFSLRCVNE